MTWFYLTLTVHLSTSQFGHEFPRVHNSIDQFHSAWQPPHSQSVQKKKKRDENRNGGFNAKANAVNSTKNVQWQGQLTGTRGLVVIPHPRTYTLNHLLSLLFSSSFTPCSCLSGTELGRWSKFCCLRETRFYLNRAKAIGTV